MKGTKAQLIYENTVQAQFVRRMNRFASTVLLDGKEETVHVKNTGRLGELLLPGAKVTLQKAVKPGRKTAYDLISVYREDLEWVNIDSLAPNALIKMYLRETGNYDLVRPEYKIGDSRIDFYMERGSEKYLSEVKGCTLASDEDTDAGLFPDAPTVRGVKHLRELANAASEGYNCSVFFVIQMNGIHHVFPNNTTHQEFGRALFDAASSGVKIICFSCRVDADRICITGSSDDTALYSAKKHLTSIRKEIT